MAGFLDTQPINSQVEALYIAYFSRAGDGPGVVYWDSQFSTFLSAGKTVDQAATLIAQSFSVQTEAKATYGFLNNPPAVLNPLDPTQIAGVDAFINQIYQDLFNRSADAAGLAYWQGQILTGAVSVGAAVYTIGNGAAGADQTVLNDKIIAATTFTNDTFAVNLGTTTPLDPSFLNAAHNSVTPVHDAASLAASEAASAQFASFGPPVTFELTTGEDNFSTSHEATFNAPLAGIFGTQATLTDNDSLVVTGGAGQFSVLNATFDQPELVTGLNIVNVATWNIDANAQPPTIPGLPPGEFEPGGTDYGAILLSGDAAGGDVISGLRTLNFDDHSNFFSLDIGNNTQPVQEPGGADGFTINVSNAVGDDGNGVDVDIAASAFTGHDTINVTADVVGGFPLDDGGSLEVPPAIIGTSGNPDNYDPNWDGWDDITYAIASGASSGPTPNPLGLSTPPTGAVGFQTWNIDSIGAIAVEPATQLGVWTFPTGVNSIALGGEGSWTATTINLTDDGSSTILWASLTSDSLLTDWEHITTINLSQTSGFVVLTGLEATNQDFDLEGGGDGGSFVLGLLTDDTTALKTIIGGSGNSFYDLSSLTAATAEAASIDGGHSTAANSEVAFNNSVLTIPSGHNINITHIQVLDDASDVQGGTIDMNNFVQLLPTNAPYTLLGGGVIPTGYQVLQLLNSDGSTAAVLGGLDGNGNVLGSNLLIANGPTHFAINMQDVADGWYVDANGNPVQTDFPPGDGAGIFGSTGNNITIFGESVVPQVNVNNTLLLYISDGASPPGLEREGPDLPGPPVLAAQAPIIDQDSTDPVYNVPVFAVDNYTTVNIYIPWENDGDVREFGGVLNPDHDLEGEDADGPDLGNDIGLGTKAFIDQPIPTVGSLGTPTASVTFFDNQPDNGGSPPGGPDNLYVGHTQTYDLGTGLQSYFGSPEDVSSLIGVTTVSIDVNLPGPLSTTMTDTGAGRFEVGATNVFFLTDSSTAATAHLVMDLPATGFNDEPGLSEDAENTTLDHGITVVGAIDGQNLLQGSSGDVQYDHAHFIDDGNVNDAFIGATANDVITGGTGSGGNAGNNNLNGDNIFGEGGTDTINLNHVAHGASSTVWFAAYDVGYSGPLETGTQPGVILEQAVTDVVRGNTPTINPFTDEGFVNNYATSVTTVNGFQFGDTGDTIQFMISSWATDFPDNINGLVNWNGHDVVTPGDAKFSFVGTAEGSPDFGTTVLLDGIGGGYLNAAALQEALTTEAIGNIFLFGNGVSAHQTVDMLIAYQAAGLSQINIADVTITNTDSTSHIDTANPNLHVSVTDLLHLTEPLGVGLSNFDPHNIHFNA